MNKYARELGDVLRTFDPQKMRKFTIEHKDMYEPVYLEMINSHTDEWLRGCMAKMVMNRIDMNEEERAMAMGILEELGWNVAELTTEAEATRLGAIRSEKA